MIFNRLWCGETWCQDKISHWRGKNISLLYNSSHVCPLWWLIKEKIIKETSSLLSLLALLLLCATTIWINPIVWFIPSSWAHYYLTSPSTVNKQDKCYHCYLCYIYIYIYFTVIIQPVYTLFSLHIILSNGIVYKCMCFMYVIVCAIARRSSKRLVPPTLTLAKWWAAWKLNTRSLNMAWHSQRSGTLTTH